ncbi:hypothetical protein JRO89_XS10G0212800 [Xanthoceras sorbifolium]|uniref:Uncharacterized protein n=1 Tax=Xanthoceras sorbifolium TaxID=99658 RepID=A0ABQ8HJT5_9ROSI|nr:hypothetical protein JRO89_XS10G0212800 [Xanthoceras sorbifolium]
MDEEDAIQEDVEAVSKIYLHAIARTCAVETMRIQGKLGHTLTIVLVDSGSTYNFMSEKLAQKVGLQPKTGEHFKVMVSSGEKSLCTQVSLTLQEAPHPKKVSNSCKVFELDKLLNEFQDVFYEPKGLPPSRVHDHKIPLQLEAQPVCVKPVRYPHYQKA